jgi:CSLREA domain-containing protein
MIVLKARGLPVGSSRVVGLGLVMMVVATLLMAAGTLVVGARPAEAATTFTVNKTDDGDDRNLSDARCDTSRNNGSQCTLRAAIEESNDTAGADTIEFDISAAAQTIKPGSQLPTITDTVTIDAYTQQGASPNTLAEGNDAVLKVKLNGSNAGASAEGRARRGS